LAHHFCDVNVHYGASDFLAMRSVYPLLHMIYFRALRALWLLCSNFTVQFAGNRASFTEQSCTFGIMGGWNQSQAHAQFVADVVDFKMNIQAALEFPRFTKLTFSGCDLLRESRIPGNVRKELQQKGPPD
jgi:hypothetical protein